MEGVQGIVRDLRLPRTSMDLLRKIQGEAITMDQFLKDCAYWALMTGFDQLRPHALPCPPPKVEELNNIPPHQRTKVDYLKIYNDYPQVKSYYEQRYFILNRNKSNLEWLRQLRKYIPETDFDSQRKIDDRILEFEASKDEFNEFIDGVKEMFGAVEVGEDY